MSELKRFAGYHAVKEEPLIQLPRGGYIAKILNVKLDRSRYDRERITFMVEIVEGPYQGFYHRDYEARKGGTYEAKYRGIYNIARPMEDGSEQSLRDIDRFNRTMGAVESSNPGYRWDWHLNSLKDKIVGLSVREYEYQGGVYTEIGKFIPIDTIRNGLFRPMNKRIAQADNASLPQLGSQPYLPPLASMPQTAASASVPPRTPYLPQVPPQPPASGTPVANGYVQVDDDEIPF